MASCMLFRCYKISSHSVGVQWDPDIYLKYWMQMWSLGKNIHVEEHWRKRRLQLNDRLTTVRQLSLMLHLGKRRGCQTCWSQGKCIVCSNEAVRVRAGSLQIWNVRDIYFDAWRISQREGIGREVRTVRKWALIKFVLLIQSVHCTWSPSGFIQ